MLEICLKHAMSGLILNIGDSVYDLINELKEGHRVIVGVDAHELWAEPGTEEYEFYRNLTNADHALIVTSVNIDPANPETQRLY